MTHETRLPQCEEFQCHIKAVVDEHVRESISVRSDVQRHNEQILTLNRAHEAVMQDIKEIKDDIKNIREAVLGLKIWILSAAVAGLISLTGIALWMGGDKKQVEINSSRLNYLEEIHPRAGK